MTSAAVGCGEPIRFSTSIRWSRRPAGKDRFITATVSHGTCDVKSQILALSDTFFWAVILTPVRLVQLPAAWLSSAQDQGVLAKDQNLDGLPTPPRVG